MISCIILAGGKSERVNEGKKKKTDKSKKGKRKASAKKKKAKRKSKAFMKLNKKPLVVHVFDTVKKFFPEIVIVVKTKKQAAEMKKLIDDPRVSIVADKDKTFSPIVGIKTGLKHAKGEDVFVTGCDMPFLNGVTIFRLMNRTKKSVDCVVPSKAGKHQPLCAIYKRRVFRKAKPEESLHDVIERSKKLLVPIYKESEFFNINTKEDLKQAEKMLGEKLK